MKKNFRRQSGFTLVEIIMSITIVVILAGVMAPLMKAVGDLFSFQTRRVILEESGMYAVSRMSREIRRLRDDRSVITATEDDFEFIDRDGRQIRYYLDGDGTIHRTEDGTDDIFLDQIQAGGLVFYYYDNDTADDATSNVTALAGAGVKTNIRYMKILIKMQNGTQTYGVRQAMRLRNVQFRESEIFF